MFPIKELYTPRNFILYLQRKINEKRESSIWSVRYYGFSHEEIILGNRYERLYEYGKNLLYNHGYDIFEYLLEDHFDIEEETFFENAIKKFEKDCIFVPFDIIIE